MSCRRSASIVAAVRLASSPCLPRLRTRRHDGASRRGRERWRMRRVRREGPADRTPGSHATCEIRSLPKFASTRPANPCSPVDFGWPQFVFPGTAKRRGGHDVRRHGEAGGGVRLAQQRRVLPRPRRSRCERVRDAGGELPAPLRALPGDTITPPTARRRSTPRCRVPRPSTPTAGSTTSSRARSRASGPASRAASRPASSPSSCWRSAVSRDNAYVAPAIHGERRCAAGLTPTAASAGASPAGAAAQPNVNA